MRHRFLAILAASLLACLAGCQPGDQVLGYSTTSIYPAGIQTVAVPIPVNDTFDRGVEFELVDALVKEVESRTPYKVTSGDDAHTILRVTIRQVDLDQLSKSRLTGLSEEVIVSVTIDFEWLDQRNGTTLVARRAFTGTGLFVPSRPTGEPIELGRFAAVQQLARDIVSELQAEW